MSTFDGDQEFEPQPHDSDEFDPHDSEVCSGCGRDIDHCMCSEPEEREDNFRDDVEADADVLRSAGMGTDEDYEHNLCDEGDDW